MACLRKESISLAVVWVCCVDGRQWICGWKDHLGPAGRAYKTSSHSVASAEEHMIRGMRSRMTQLLARNKIN